MTASPVPSSGQPDLLVDLRSDEVTQPTDEMWAAMTDGPLGWSKRVDHDIERAEALAAEVLGTQGALFVPTGTMANTLAMLYWTNPGGRFVAERRAHVLSSEDDAFSRVAHTYPYPVDSERGLLPVDELREALDHAYALGHRSPIELVWLENTHTAAGGTADRPSALEDLSVASGAAGVPLHLDGARLVNAAAAHTAMLNEFVRHVDSVTFNVNKGLSAPAGAFLAGPEDLVAHSRSRMVGLGGNIGQLGLLARAASVALTTMTTQPSVDNAVAAEMSVALDSAGFSIPHPPETNIILCRLPEPENSASFLPKLTARNVGALAYDSRTLRLVTHRHVTSADVPTVVKAFVDARDDTTHR